MPAAENKIGQSNQDAVGDDISSLKGDVENLRKDLGRLFDDLKTLTKSEAEEAGRKAQELKGAAVEVVRDKREDVEEYVREHPLGALAAAAGVGFVLALLVARN